MYLQSISLINFKNYEQAEFGFSPKINCIVGNNGVGKTNLLDAIYYLSFCKSFFNSIDSQNIRHGQEFFVVQGNYDRQDKNEDIYCGFKRSQKKQFKRNKKEYERLADHIGLLPLVMVSPYDINLITEGSEERRRFIDSVISQYDKQYLYDLIKYNRALAQRNSLLKDFRKNRTFDKDALEIWNEQLIGLGVGIHQKRVGYINEFLPIFRKYYEFISGGSEVANLVYQSQLNEGDFREHLQNSVEKDLAVEYTTVGIHKDDLQLILGEYPLKKEGSQGQQKTYLLSLKLAEFDFIKQINGIKPALLLDDVFAKLDSLRTKQIMTLVAENHFGQIFITDTNKKHLEDILSDIGIEYKFFEIGG